MQYNLTHACYIQQASSIVLSTLWVVSRTVTTYRHYLLIIFMLYFLQYVHLLASLSCIVSDGVTL